MGRVRSRGARGSVAALASIALLVPMTVAAAGPPTPTPSTGHFVALSYNVAGLPEGISGSEPATNSSLISPLLNDYDLVLLQESWADPVEDAFPGAREQFEFLPVFFFHHEIVADADHPYRSEPAAHPWGTDLRRAPHGPTLVSDGLNRLSRFAFDPELLTREMWEECHGDLVFVVGEEALDATGLDDVLDSAGLGDVNDEIDGGSADCMAQKGFSMARTVFAPGVEIDVYNLHADAGGHSRDIAARADNFRQLAEFILEESTDRAVILGGDTNLRTGDSRPGRSEFDDPVWGGFLEETGLRDVCDTLDCGDDAHSIDKFAFRSGGGVELKALDHGFEREKFEREDGEPLSDHDPLAVRFEWRLVGGSPQGS